MIESLTLSADEITIPVGGKFLSGTLTIPPQAKSVVLFAHGSGSSRHSPRNRFVAGELNEASIATLLADLLTPHEEEFDLLGGETRFDIPLLTTRLAGLIDWLAKNDTTKDLPLGLFGASTGAAAALDAAAARPKIVQAIVSRGGRPDLATQLGDVHAPTLLIVGGNDPVVLRLNQQALQALHCTKALEVVPGATHLFEEPGSLDSVAALATNWFSTYLTAR